ncbi:hypothetical protein M0812_04644 [Anaeramoeba flamelloides]|uniref:Myotubularin phosphatase domain-containing protein n=1 Tax=Anaeramoeba flamelloides TaxID=1746091 RepID=A0AAV8AEZ0_9EUKA|nr:hypothetical protein M0812_04644 [Anaeramoeba flamelloides]
MTQPRHKSKRSTSKFKSLSSMKNYLTPQNKHKTFSLKNQKTLSLSSSENNIMRVTNQKQFSPPKTPKQSNNKNKNKKTKPSRFDPIKTPNKLQFKQKQAINDQLGMFRLQKLKNGIACHKIVKPEHLHELHLEGEKELRRVQKVIYSLIDVVGNPISFHGVIVLTNARLFFVPQQQTFYKYFTKPIISTYLGNINKIEYLSSKIITDGEKSKNGIFINCKNFQEMKFSFQQSSKKIVKNFIDLIQSLSFPESELKLFCFEHRKDKSGIDPNWKHYNPRKEFQRQGINFEDEKMSWRYCDVNTLYKFCPTYPNFFVIPRSTKLLMLSGCAKFRSKRRVPILSYYHKINKATLTRGSQPKVGVKRNRNEQDENFLEAIRNANDNKKQLFIIDCRPKKNAVGNIAKGGGYEISDNYPNCQLIFLGIENIHVMRKSFEKLRELCLKVAIKPKEQNWLSLLDDTDWFTHIQLLIKSTRFVVEVIVYRGISIFVHCSDGWDRTAQICSLAEICIDPFYRTIEGFYILMEKEWCSFGHQFSKRLGHAERNSKESQRSPIFVQFVDTVYQFLVQRPGIFEFNENYLIFILENIYTSRYGNFVYNFESERVQNSLPKNTYSIWGAILKNKKQFLNPFYKKSSATFLPSFFPYHISFWENYYLKHYIPLQFLSTNCKIDIDLENKYLELKSDLIYLNNQLQQTDQLLIDYSNNNNKKTENTINSSQILKKDEKKKIGIKKQANNNNNNKKKNIANKSKNNNQYINKKTVEIENEQVKNYNNISKNEMRKVEGTKKKNEKKNIQLQNDEKKKEKENEIKLSENNYNSNNTDNGTNSDNYHSKNEENNNQNYENKNETKLLQNKNDNDNGTKNDLKPKIITKKKEIMIQQSKSNSQLVKKNGENGKNGKNNKTNKTNIKHSKSNFTKKRIPKPKLKRSISTPNNNKKKITKKLPPLPPKTDKIKKEMLKIRSQKLNPKIKNSIVKK